MTFEDLAEKFRNCAEYARWPNSSVEAIIEKVRALERLQDVGDLMMLLRKGSDG